MAGTLLAPNPYNNTTSGVRWAPGYTGPRTTTRQVGTAPATTTTASSRRWVNTANGPMTLPNDFTDDDANQWVQAYNQYMATVQKKIDDSEGFEKLKWQEALKDAQAGRDNAVKIAQMQQDTSKYGVDAQRQTAMESLWENQRQFDQTHGLDVAKAFTEYGKTYDDLFALQDLKSAVGNVSQGGGPTGVMQQQGQPHAKTWQDFAALSNYGGGQGVGGGYGQQGGGGDTDPRMKATTAIMKALPPSQTPGHDYQDYAALNAIQSLYASGRPGEVERLGKERQKAAQGGLRRLGYNPALVDEDRRRGLPNQGSVRAA